MEPNLPLPPFFLAGEMFIRDLGETKMEEKRRKAE